MQSTELSVKHLGLRPDRHTAELFRFQIFDGSSRVVIEAQSEEDARCLCRQMSWEFICVCEG